MVKSAISIPQEGQGQHGGGRANRYLIPAGMVHPASTTPERAWNIPSPTPYFTGREELLYHVQQHLARHKTAALTQPQTLQGQGGVGKTQVACEYAARHRQAYRYGFWVNAATHETMIISMLDIARMLLLPERQAQDHRVMVEAVKTWLNTHGDWLLLLDNADDLALTAAYLPTSRVGHVLLTTRHPEPGSLAYGLEVEQMDTQEALVFLLRRMQKQEGLQGQSVVTQAPLTARQVAKQVVQAVDGLPLALEQAGAYIAETRCTLEAYLQRYQHQQRLLLQRRGRYTGHPGAVTTWMLSFRQIEQHNRLAAEILRTCALLAPDAIPDALFLQGASALGGGLQALEAEPARLNEALALLRRFALVRPQPERQTFSLHRQVQTAILESLEETNLQRLAGRLLCALNQAFPQGSDYRSWLQCQYFVPQVQASTLWIERWSLSVPEAAHLFEKVGYALKQRAQYAQAERLLQGALAISEQTVGAQHPDLVSRLTHLAALYREQGRHAEAEPLLRRALAISEQTVGLQHPNLVAILTHLATICYTQRSYEEAERLYQRSLAISEQTVGAQHPDLVSRLTHLANLYRDQGRYTEAEPLYRRAGWICEQKLGPQHPTLAFVMSNVALLYKQQKRYGEAERFLRRAIAISEQVLGPQHPELVSRLTHLAAIYYEQGRYEAAEPLLQLTIALGEQILGPHHPDLAPRLNSLATLYHQQGRHTEAELLHQRALALKAGDRAGSKATAGRATARVARTLSVTRVLPV
jgi:tetratricopeptide (TPR) repeat protein